MGNGISHIYYGSLRYGKIYGDTKLTRARQLTATALGPADEGGHVYAVLGDPCFLTNEYWVANGWDPEKTWALAKFLIIEVARGDPNCANYLNWAIMVIRGNPDLLEKETLQIITNLVNSDTGRYYNLHPDYDPKAIGIHYSATNIPGLTVEDKAIRIEWLEMFLPEGEILLGNPPSYVSL